MKLYAPIFLLLVAAGCASEPTLRAVDGQVARGGSAGSTIEGDDDDDDDDDDDGDEAVAFADLPQAVVATLETEFPDAIWLEAETDGETFEVLLEDMYGVVYEVTVDADGQLLDIEDEDEEDDDDEEGDDDGEDEDDDEDDDGEDDDGDDEEDDD